MRPLHWAIAVSLSLLVCLPISGCERGGRSGAPAAQVSAPTSATAAASAAFPQPPLPMGQAQTAPGTPAGLAALLAAPRPGRSTNWDEPVRAPSSAAGHPWSSLPALGAALAEPALEDYQGRVYCFGGDEGQGPTAAVRCYDPALRAWTAGGALAQARAGAAAARIGPAIYVLGGHDGRRALATVERYDVPSGVVRTVAPMNSPRSGAVAAVIGERIYVFGGSAEDTGHIQRALDSAEVYDALRDTWRAIAPLPGPRWALQGTSVDDRVYLFGGHDGGQGARAAHDESMVYDPLLDRYQGLASSRIRRHAGVALSSQGRVYLIGGIYTIPDQLVSWSAPREDVRYETNLVEVYDIAADRWSTRVNMLTARAHVGGTMADGLAYLVGGQALDLDGGPGSAPGTRLGWANAATGPVPAGQRTLRAACEVFDPLTVTGASPPLPSGGSGGTTAPGNHDTPLASGGRARTYRLYVPRGYHPGRAHPLAVLLHGSNTTADETDQARFEVQADRDGVLILKGQGVATLGPSSPPIYAPGYPGTILSIWPLGLSPVPGETHVPGYPQNYNAGQAATSWEMHDWTPQVNLDYAYILDAIAQVSTAYNVDRRRIYQFGQSGGALFTGTVGTHHGELYAACASQAGGDIVSAYQNSTSYSFLGLSSWPQGLGPQGPDAAEVARTGARRTPFLFIHATKDQDVPIAGALGLQRAMRQNGWAEAESIVHVLENGGHVWFTLNEEVWSFLMAHALP